MVMNNERAKKPRPTGFPYEVVMRLKEGNADGISWHQRLGLKHQRPALMDSKYGIPILQMIP
ncbi:uncharacterized protein PgNI_12214 [Pyricularia grisea]|uniref:Uncharacterized protein n=1 Tax=Pyricularia grisea TaxID=148305 RepID=A0A6P8AR77_PYRGI|nr:uncharacterized protein PgNI_12214 [Pyricularia grisea]TLD04543.1 hypothetical protein PgNI_12214 [Pyricularia grisea]